MVTLLLDHQSQVKDRMTALVERVTPPSPLREMCLHHLSSGGKGFRSGLCLSLCRALGADPAECLPAAVSLELAHRTSLVFDDIQDHTPTRNSHTALWYEYGMEQAINAGLALSACARVSLLELDSSHLPQGASLRVLEILERSVMRLCNGQYWDLEFQRRPPPDLESYLKMVADKTGSLVGAACEIACVLAGAHGRLAGLIRFGVQLGVLFQCQDDYLGIWGDAEEVGKTPTDLLEGKRSLPVVLAHERRPQEVEEALADLADDLGRLADLVVTAPLEALTLGVVEEQRLLTLSYVHGLKYVLDPEMVASLRDLVAFVSRRRS